MASARSVLDSLSSRAIPEPEPEPLAGGTAAPVVAAPGGGGALPFPPALKMGAGGPLPMVVSQQAFRTASSPASSASLSQLLEESRAARASLTEVLSPRISPRLRAATTTAVALPPPFDLGADETGAIVAAAAGALKTVGAEPEQRGPGRPRQVSMPITPVSEEYAADGAIAGGDAVFALSPPKPTSVPRTLREAEPLSELKGPVEPECVDPVLRPRRAKKLPAARRAGATWSRREVEAEADAEQELALLRQQLNA
jgi:hypothetical protein